MSENYNVVIVEEDGKVIRASLALGVWVDDTQSTELHDTDISAAKALLKYQEQGATIPERSLKEAQKILTGLLA